MECTSMKFRNCVIFDDEEIQKLKLRVDLVDENCPSEVSLIDRDSKSFESHYGINNIPQGKLKLFKSDFCIPKIKVKPLKELQKDSTEYTIPLNSLENSTSNDCLSEFLNLPPSLLKKHIERTTPQSNPISSKTASQLNGGDRISFSAHIHDKNYNIEELLKQNIQNSKEREQWLCNNYSWSNSVSDVLPQVVTELESIKRVNNFSSNIYDTLGSPTNIIEVNVKKKVNNLEISGETNYLTNSFEMFYSDIQKNSLNDHGHLCNIEDSKVVYRAEVPEIESMTCSLTNTAEINEENSRTDTGLQICESTPSLTSSFEILSTDIHENILNKQENIDRLECSNVEDPSEVPQNVDISELKDGIIEASRTLIDTQKTLKILAKVVSKVNMLKYHQMVDTVTKFQKLLKLFQGKINMIDKTVKSHYKGLFPCMSDIDLFLKDIKQSMPVKQSSKAKRRKGKCGSNRKKE